jgi:hypothetical protein
MKEIFLKKIFLKKNILRNPLNKRLLTLFLFRKTIPHSKKPFAKTPLKTYIMLCLKPAAQQLSSAVSALH